MKHFSFIAIIMACMSLFIAKANAETLTIKAGTPIVASLDVPVSSESAQMGQTIMMRLVSPIQVGKKTAIPAGSVVNAQVTSIEDAGCFGQKGELSLRLVSVVAPDGTMVPVQASQSVVGKSKVGLSVALGILVCPLFWIMHGGEAVLPAGSQINGSVLANTDIEH